MGMNDYIKLNIHTTLWIIKRHKDQYTQTNEFYMQPEGLDSNFNGDMMHWIQKLSLRSHWNNQTFPTSYWVHKRQGTTTMANVLGAADSRLLCVLVIAGSWGIFHKFKELCEISPEFPDVVRKIVQLPKNIFWKQKQHLLCLLACSNGVTSFGIHWTSGFKTHSLVANLRSLNSQESHTFA